MLSVSHNCQLISPPNCHLSFFCKSTLHIFVSVYLDDILIFFPEWRNMWVTPYGPYFQYLVIHLYFELEIPYCSMHALSSVFLFLFKLYWSSEKLNHCNLMLLVSETKPAQPFFLENKAARNFLA